MKRVATIVFSLLIVLSMTFASSVCAFAESDTNNSAISQEDKSYSNTRGNVFPYTSYSNALAVTTTSKRLAYSTTGFNCNVKIRCELNAISNKGIVVMKDSSGNVVWNSGTTYGVPAHGSYTYWVGSNVYSIWIYTSSGYGSAWVE